MTQPPDPFARHDPFAKPDPFAKSDPFAKPEHSEPVDPYLGAPAAQAPYPPPGYPPAGYRPTGYPPPAYAPGYPPPPGGQYGYGGYPPPPQGTNGMAIASLVCSLLTLATCFTFIPGIILGHMSLNQIKRTGEQGHGMAVAGLVVGYVFGALAIMFLVAIAWGATQDCPWYEDYCY